MLTSFQSRFSVCTCWGGMYRTADTARNSSIELIYNLEMLHLFGGIHSHQAYYLITVISGQSLPSPFLPQSPDFAQWPGDEGSWMATKVQRLPHKYPRAIHNTSAKREHTQDLDGSSRPLLRCKASFYHSEVLMPRVRYRVRIVP